MIRELTLKRLAVYGADADLVDRLLLHGEYKYTTWLVRLLTDEDAVNRSLAGFAKELGLSESNVRYMYFRAPSTTRSELRKRKDYTSVMGALYRIHPNEEMWDELARYLFDQLKMTAIEQLTDEGMGAEEIKWYTHSSNGYVYKIRAKHAERLTERMKIWK